MHIAVIHRVILLGATGHTATFARRGQAEDVEVGHAGTVRLEVAVAIIISLIRRCADTRQRNILYTAGNGHEEACIDGPESHLMIADGRYSKCTFEDTGIELEKGRLPFVIGTRLVGVVAKSQEQVHRFATVGGAIGYNLDQQAAELRNDFGNGDIDVIVSEDARCWLEAFTHNGHIDPPSSMKRMAGAISDIWARPTR